MEKSGYTTANNIIYVLLESDPKKFYTKAKHSSIKQLNTS